MSNLSPPVSRHISTLDTISGSDESPLLVSDAGMDFSTTCSILKKSFNKIELKRFGKRYDWDRVTRWLDRILQFPDGEEGSDSIGLPTPEELDQVRAMGTEEGEAVE